MAYSWKEDRDFKPWAAQQKKGYTWLAVGVTTVIAGFLLPWGDWTWWMLALGVAVSLIGVMHLKRSMVRAFGKEVEAIWTRRAVAKLGGDFDIRHGVRVPGMGDADLVVLNHRSQKGTVVEIKAFVRWKTRFFGLWVGDREKAAIAQATRLRERLGAHGAVVWLPNGRRTFWQWLFAPQYPGVKVVFGGTRALRRALH